MQRISGQGGIQQAYFPLSDIQHTIHKTFSMSNPPLSIIHPNQPKSQPTPLLSSKQTQTSNSTSKNTTPGSNPEPSKEIKINCYLMRHAQSKYNQITQNCQYPALSSQAKNLYQIDPNLIDCQITQKGVGQILSTSFTHNVPSTEQWGQSTNQSQSQHETKMFDCVYVSPLNRTLQTAKLLIDHDKIRYRKIVVVPELTEVVSKICDFGDRIQEKISKYGDCFDFGLFTQKNNGQKIADFWQDGLVDPQIRCKINKNKQNGQRYIKILDQIFPTALQSPGQCLNRSIQALNRIKQLSKQDKNRNILIISHNRILKNMLTQGQNLQSFQIMKNCQIRHITL